MKVNFSLKNAHLNLDRLLVYKQIPFFHQQHRISLPSFKFQSSCNESISTWRCGLSQNSKTPSNWIFYMSLRIGHRSMAMSAEWREGCRSEQTGTEDVFIYTSCWTVALRFLQNLCCQNEFWKPNVLYRTKALSLTKGRNQSSTIADDALGVALPDWRELSLILPKITRIETTGTAHCGFAFSAASTTAGGTEDFVGRTTGRRLYARFTWGDICWTKSR